MTFLEHEVWQYRAGRWQRLSVAVVAEHAVTLYVNGQALTRFLCTPQQVEALAVGFLYNEGWIATQDEVVEMRLCADNSQIDVWLSHSIQPPSVWTRTSGCGSGQTRAAALPPEARPQWTGQLHPRQVNRLVRALFASQSLYRQTGGVHTAALSDGADILLTAEDIGRHNALDKLAGLCLLAGNPPAAPVVLTTGRISAEMLRKAYRLGAAVVISRTAPSSRAVQLAEEYGVTLIGYARAQRFTVYAGPQRLAREEETYPPVA